jgi:hypothetical protein
MAEPEKARDSPVVPEAGPDGTVGVSGGWFSPAGSLTVTVRTADQPEDDPEASDAITRTEKVPAEIHAWVPLTVVPEATGSETQLVLSPQSKVARTVSPSGSAAELA